MLLGGAEEGRTRGRLRLRRSDMTNIERARTRTLRMTITIVVAFIWCWTPYVVMTLWYMFDRESAERVDPRVQDGFFIMAVSNSVMNPIVYGSYAMNLKRGCRGSCCSVFSCNNQINRKPVDAGDNLHSRGLLLVPKCVLTLVKGSGITRSTGVVGVTTSFTKLPPNQKATSMEEAGESGEASVAKFHSDPGVRGVYLLDS